MTRAKGGGCPRRSRRGRRGRRRRRGARAKSASPTIAERSLAPPPSSATVIARALIFDAGHARGHARVRRALAGSSVSGRRAPRSGPPGVAITLWPPRKRATNSVAGFSNTSRGEPACSILPLFITTTRSASASASSWPWVTWTKGMPRLRLQAPQFGAHAHAQERVERRQRLVEQQDLRLGDQRARERDALLLAARQLRRHALRRRAPSRRA